MGKQFYCSDEKEIIYIRTTKTIHKWLKKLAFEQEKSLNM